MNTNIDNRLGWRERGACVLIATIICAPIFAGLVYGSMGIFENHIRVDLTGCEGQPKTVPIGYTLCDYVVVNALAVSPMAVSREEDRAIERQHMWIISNIDWSIADGRSADRARVSRDALLRGAFPEIGRVVRDDQAVATKAFWGATGPINHSIVSDQVIEILATRPADSPFKASSLFIDFKFYASNDRVAGAMAAFAAIVTMLAMALGIGYRFMRRSYSAGRTQRRFNVSWKNIGAVGRRDRP